MKTAIVKLKSASPYGQGQVIREVKPRGETHDDFEKRTWMQRAHLSEDGIVMIPAQAFKSALCEAAKYSSIKIPGKGQSTYTRRIVSGVMCLDDVSTGVPKEDIIEHPQHVPSDGVSGSGKRVWKSFPKIMSWEATVKFLILDEIVTKEIFTEFMVNAGRFIGLGVWRPENKGAWGRFSVEKVEFKEGSHV